MEKIEFSKPIIGLCAYSGSGKTTLLEKLIPTLNAQNIRVAVIKHAHHSFDIDHPEKDSYKIRKAGAQQMLISSQKRWALIHENSSDHAELTLPAALQLITIGNIDIIIVEGFKSAPIPKIEIHRPNLGSPLICAEDKYVIAIATDEPSKLSTSLPLLDLNSPEQIALFMQKFITEQNI